MWDKTQGPLFVQKLLLKFGLKKYEASTVRQNKLVPKFSLFQWKCLKKKEESVNSWFSAGCWSIVLATGEQTNRKHTYYLVNPGQRPTGAEAWTATWERWTPALTWVLWARGSWPGWGWPVSSAQSTDTTGRAWPVLRSTTSGCLTVMTPASCPWKKTWPSGSTPWWVRQSSCKSKRLDV